MAGVLAVNATFKWKAVDYSAYLTEITMTRTVQTKPTGTFGTLDMTFVEAQRETKLSIKYLFDKASAAPDNPFFSAPGAGAGAFEYYPESSAAGASNIKYSGNAILIKHEDRSKFDEVANGSADFQVTGALARAVIA